MQELVQYMIWPARHVENIKLCPAGEMRRAELLGCNRSGGIYNVGPEMSSSRFAGDSNRALTARPWRCGGVVKA